MPQREPKYDTYSSHLRDGVDGLLDPACTVNERLVDHLVGGEVALEVIRNEV